MSYPLVFFGAVYNLGSDKEFDIGGMCCLAQKKLPEKGDPSGKNKQNTSSKKKWHGIEKNKLDIIPTHPTNSGLESCSKQNDIIQYRPTAQIKIQHCRQRTFQ